MIKKAIYIPIVILMLITVSCGLFTPEPEGVPVAKVHEVYLYEEDINDFNIPVGLTEKDSVTLLTESIDNWASNQLLLDQAKKNMSESKQDEFNKLIRAYEMDLFVSAYKNVYVKKNLNTIISEEEIKNYYGKHKESFLLKEDLVKARYIKLPLNYKDISATKKKFTRFNEGDKEELNKMRAGFIDLDFNEEDTWQTYDEFIGDLPKLASLDKGKTISNKSAVQFKKNQVNYLYEIDKRLRVGNIAPVEYARTTIKQILLNKRKLALQKKLEKEITKDALQTEDYTIFQ